MHKNDNEWRKRKSTITMTVVGENHRGHHLQHVTDHAHGPHVRFQADRFVADDLRWNELRRSEENSRRLVGLEFLRQPKVNELDLVRSPRLAHYVFRLWKPKRCVSATASIKYSFISYTCHNRIVNWVYH